MKLPPKKDSKNSTKQTSHQKIVLSASTIAERQQMERVNRIHGFFNSGGKTNAPELARKLKLSERTIHRVFDILLNDWGMPLEHDQKTKKSYYTHKVKHFPGRYATEGDIFTLMLANGSLRECVSEKQRRIVTHTFRKIAANYKDLISFDFDYLDNCVSFCDTAKPILEPDLIRNLLRAIAKRQQLKIRYDTPHKKPRYRVIDPYHLRKVNSDWLLFVFDHDRDEVIRLALPRIHDPSKTGETFIRPIDFKATDYLKGAFGTYAGEDLYPVIVRVTKQQVHIIREKIWPCQKKLVELPDGGVELHMELSSLMDVHPWILSFDGDAAPVYPPQLQEMFGCAQKKGAALLESIQKEQSA